MKSNSNLLPLICCGLILLSIGGCGHVNVANSGSSSSMEGRIIGIDGKSPAQYALVYLRSIDYIAPLSEPINQNRSDSAYCDSTYTDDSGIYKFESIPYDIYSVEARDGSNNCVFRDSITIFDCAESLVCFNDTLKPPSSLLGILPVEDGSEIKYIRVFGLNVYQKITAKDTFFLTGIPQGKLRLQIITVSNGNFQFDTTRVVTKASDTNTIFKVLFDSRGGTPIHAQIVNDSDFVHPPSAPVLPDSLFNGWYKDTSFVNSWIFDKDVVTAPVTLYAKWGYPDGMALIPAKNRQFEMGGTKNDETPIHRVNFSFDFYLDSTETTQGSYDRLMKATYIGYTRPLWTTLYGIGDNYPAYNVSWFDALLYCNARTKEMGNMDTVYSYTRILGIPGNGCIGLEGLRIDFSKRGFRLPTEAQWEYACRGGTMTSFYWGTNFNPYPSTADDSSEIDRYSIWSRNSYDKGSSSADFGAHPVATKVKNIFGLYDMSGNLWEWCNDWYGNYTAESQTDPTGPINGSFRVLRGGCWIYGAVYLRSDSRYINSPDNAFYAFGFRTCLPY